MHHCQWTDDMDSQAHTLNSQVDGQYIFTVSELNHSVRVFLEQQFGQVYVSGEISNLSQPSSGHLYFSLKDQQAQVRCCFFRNKQPAFGLKLQNGMQIVVAAQLSLYPERGEYQLIVNRIFDAGLGLLQQQFEALKQKLATAGLFADSHKKPLPTFPKTIGVITSETGAALQDVLSVLKRRFPAITVHLYPCQVQGAEAPRQLIAAIELANRHRTCDVLLLTRGGGSLEDLWAFNDEQLAYAIYRSELPIVSAVGHEVDFTIADFVADRRAPTPSAAAELLSPDQEEFANQLGYWQSRLLQKMQQQIKVQQQHLQHLQKRLQHPAQRLAHKAQHLDHLSMQLHRDMKRIIQAYRYRLDISQSHLKRLSPLLNLQHQQQRLAAQRVLMQQRINHLLQLRSQRLSELSGKLHALSPLATLQRGFAIAQNSEQQVIFNSEQVKIGDRVHLKLATGSIDCEVSKVNR
jgi:exodeoxyribonuclease VII large subunit